MEDGPLTDELYAVIKEFTSQHPELKVISLPTNRGLGKALNEGLKHCSYDLVARMDTDDIAKPDRFEKQLAIFLEHPEIDVVGAWIDEFEGEVSNVLSMRKVPEQHENILRFAKGRWSGEPSGGDGFGSSAVLKVEDISIFLCSRIIICGYGC